MELLDELRAARDDQELFVTISNYSEIFEGTEHAEELWQIFEVIGSAHLRPNLRRSLAETQRQQNERLAEIVAVMQERGVIDPDLDPWATAVIFQAITLGRLLGIIDETGKLDPKSWSELAGRFLGSIIVKH